MDISLLSKMISQLVLERDEIALPGMGTFVAEMMPASFSDKGYTINPPYRRLSFYGWKSDDKSLVELYARSNGISIDRAEAYLLAFVQELKEVLLLRKTIVLPGLGRLRATRDDKFFFVGDEELDIFPDGVGLQSISLKNNNLDIDGGWNAPEFTVSSVLETATEPAVTETATEPDAVAETSEMVKGELAPELPREKAGEKGSRSGRKFLKFVVGLIVICALALAAFLLVARFAPDFVDSLLYTEEELEILRWQI